MKPLDEYMLFTKAGSEKVNITNSQGVRSAQCAFFDVMHKPQSGPSLNISFVSDIQMLKRGRKCICVGTEVSTTDLTSK